MNARARVAALLTAVGAGALFWRKRSGSTGPGASAADTRDATEAEDEAAP